MRSHSQQLRCKARGAAQLDVDLQRVEAGHRRRRRQRRGANVEIAVEQRRVRDQRGRSSADSAASRCSRSHSMSKWRASKARKKRLRIGARRSGRLEQPRLPLRDHEALDLGTWLSTCSGRQARDAFATRSLPASCARSGCSSRPLRRRADAKLFFLAFEARAFRHEWEREQRLAAESATIVPVIGERDAARRRSRHGRDAAVCGDDGRLRHAGGRRSS